jgi:hypothetical protein
MEDYPKLVERPGVHHVMTQMAPHTPAQEAWFEQTCEQVERLFARLKPRPDRTGWFSLGVHVIADHIFERHGAEATWDRVDAHAVCEFAMQGTLLGASPVPAAGVALYTMLGESGEVDPQRAAQLVAEFKLWRTLVTTAPNRAQRRAQQARRRRMTH